MRNFFFPRTEMLLLLLLLLSLEETTAKLIQRNFNISNIANSTWVTLETIGSARDYAGCSFACLQNISACAAFSLQDGVCEIGVYSAFMPLPYGVGRQIYRVIPSADDDSDYEPGLALAPVGHVAWFGLGNGQWDYSLNTTLSPQLSLPAIPSALTSYGCSYNFYRNNRFFVCGGHTDHPNYGSQACYSWGIGGSAGFVLEPGQMKNAHVVGSGVDMGGIGFFVSAGYYSNSDSCHPYTEVWQNGVWAAGPQLPGSLCEHTSAQVSSTKVMITGGRWTDKNGGLSTSTYIYDFANPTSGWQNAAGTPGSNRVRSSAAGPVTLSDGKAYAILTGGITVSNSNSQSNEAHKYDIALNVWTAIQAVPNAQAQAGSLVIGGQMFTNWYANDVWAYSTAGGWTNLAHVSSVSMHGTQPVPYNG